MLLENVILRNVRASQPVATVVGPGTLYCVTDEGDIVERSNGAAWQAFSPGSVSDVTITTHGLVPIAPNDVTKFLNGLGLWSVPGGGGGSGTVTHTVGALTANRLVLGNGAADVTVLGSAGTANQLLHGGSPPTFSAVVEADLALTNITTADVGIAAHGFAPIAPNDATKYLNGVGAWSVPATGAAAAGTLTGATLAAGVLASSLTSVGILAALTVTATIVGSVTGNAATATAFQTARNINGVSFDGSAPITVPAAAGTLTGATLAAGVTASSLTSVGTLATLTVTATITGSVTGNAATATLAAASTVLATSRTINGVGFDGSGNITVTADATTLTGASLAAGVLGSSLTSVGALTGGSTGAGFTVALSTATVTGSLADARLSANVPLLNAVNIFSVGQNVTGSVAGTIALLVTHSTPSTTSQARIAVITDSGAVTVRLQAYCSTFVSTTAYNGANIANLYGAGTGGFTIASVTPGSDVRFYTTALAGSATLRGTMFSTGGFSWGDTTDPGATNMRVAGTLLVVGALTATLTGNASTATALQTTRAINGVNFDGSAAITVPAAAGTLTGATLAAGVTASSLTSVGTLAALTVTATITGAVNGNAATATALATPRTINGTSFNGTANITLPAPVFTVVTSTATGTVNNWAPGLAGHTLVEWSGAADATFTGLASGVTGQIVTVKNTGTFVAYFAHQSGSSSAGNKWRNLATSASTPIAAGGAISFTYDGTDWQLVAHQQGAWISPVFSAGDYGAVAPLTLTVDSGDVQGCAYYLSGRSLTVSFTLQTTTTGGTTAALLTVAIPNGFTTASALIDVLGSNFDNAVAKIGKLRAQTGVAYIRVSNADGSNFAIQTNTLSFGGTIVFQVN